jgi:hypothetical protein
VQTNSLFYGLLGLAVAMSKMANTTETMKANKLGRDHAQMNKNIFMFVVLYVSASLVHSLASLARISLCVGLGHGFTNRGLPTAGNVLLVQGAGSLDNRVSFLRGLGVSDSDFLSQLPVPRLSLSCGICFMVGANVLSAWAWCMH